MKALYDELSRVPQRLKGRTEAHDFLARLVIGFAEDWQVLKQAFVNIVITGPPGSGKTSFAQILGDILRRLGLLLTDRFTETSRADWVAQYVGQTAIKTQTLLTENLEGVLFLDEAYDLARRDPNTGQADDYGVEAITTLVNFLDKNRSQIVVIAAGYRRRMLCDFFGVNPGLKRRFPFVIDLPPYPAKTLETIFFGQAEFAGVPQTWFTPQAQRLARRVFSRFPVLFEFGGGDTENLAKFAANYVSNSGLEGKNAIDRCQMFNIFQQFAYESKQMLLEATSDRFSCENSAAAAAYY